MNDKTEFLRNICTYHTYIHIFNFYCAFSIIRESYLICKLLMDLMAAFNILSLTKKVKEINITNRFSVKKS